MEGILDKNNFPKFLVVKDLPDCNKYLMKPYERGELVKVAPFEEQKGKDESVSEEWFRKRFVVIYRKDDCGKWTLRYIQSWKYFDFLKHKGNEKN